MTAPKTTRQTAESKGLAVPEDRKPKADAEEGSLIHKLDNGKIRIGEGEEEFEVRAALDDDWEFAEYIGESEDGQIGGLVKMAKYALMDNSDAYAALKEAAKVDGRVSTDKMQNLIRDVVNATAPNS